MGKKKEVPELSELQKEQRRRAAAAPHTELCACMQCFYRARRAALEGGESTFMLYVDWRTAQELKRAARARLVLDDQPDATLEGGDAQYMPPKPGTRVVTVAEGERLFIAGAVGDNQVQQDPEQLSAEDAEALRVARDPAAWIDANILVSELGKDFKLADYQRRVLAKMFVFDELGKVAIDEALWCEPKKGGKTTLMAALGLWWGDTQESPNEVLVMANDLEQAASRAFATMVTLLAKNPELGKRARRTSNTTIKFTTGTTIRAIASEYAGAAGSNHGLTLWDEVWPAPRRTTGAFGTS
jgi:hypothetical protein